MIRKCGLLRCGTDGSVARTDVSAAYDFYRDTGSKPDDPIAVEFRASHSIVIDIHFVGVWDTVGSLGIPGTASWFPFARKRYQFHDT